MRLIVIEKLARSEEPSFPSAQWSQYQLGADNGAVSVPSGYVIRGMLLEPIAVGKPVCVLRTMRNGVSEPGIFTSSPVVAVDASTFETANSVYGYSFVSVT